MSEQVFYLRLGNAIREARKRIGWSQLRLAVELGFTSSVAVCHWEKAVTRPSAFVLYRLDKVFGEGWR